MPEADRRAADQHVVADPVDQLAVGDDIGAAHVERLSADFSLVGRAREHLDHVTFVDRGACGCVRHAGHARTGSRSTSRTRKRNERDLAPITIEARNATAHGLPRKQHVLHCEPACEVRGGAVVRRDEPTQVDDSLYPGCLRGEREVLALPRVHGR